MEGDWLTYGEATERLNTTPEAVRQKVIRGRWQRTVGNNKRARARLPDGWLDAVRTPSGRPNKPAVRTPSEPRTDTQLIKALEAHVATLKEQLAAAEARIDKQADDLVGYDTAYAAGLAAERAKVEKAIAQGVAMVEAERARADKAIAAFSSLAERLDALAEERRRPWPWWRWLGLGWWRRLAGG
jgi:hypothetical protein